MTSLESLRDIRELELFLGIRDSDRKENIRGAPTEFPDPCHDHYQAKYDPQQDSGEVVGYLTIDPNTGEVRFDKK